MADGDPAGVHSVPPRFVQPRPLVRWAALATAVAGWGLCLLLTQASLPGARQTPLLDTLCGRGEGGTGGCRGVLASAYGSVPLSRQEGSLRLPVSILGMGYFASVGLWFLFIGPPTRSRAAWHALLLALVLVGAGVSIFYVRVMATTLREWCPLCVAVHGLNGLLLLLALLSLPWRKASASALVPHPSARLVAATVTASILIAFAHVAAALTFVIGGQAQRLSDAYRRVVEDPDYAVWNWERQPAVELPTRDSAAFTGPADARLTVVVFSDFQCPRCRAAHTALSNLAADPNASVRFAMRHFPLDAACNDDPRYGGPGGHVDACRAARAVEAARLVGGEAAAWRMTEHLFSKRGNLVGEDEATWAAAIGLDASELAGALPRGVALVAEDVALGRRLGIHEVGVPMVFVNGRRFDGWSVAAAWDRLRERGERGPTTRQTE